MKPLSRPLAVAGAVIVQVALAIVAVGPQLSARLTGTEYRLAVAPVDPIDPFRGAYVELTYPGLPSPDPGTDTEADADADAGTDAGDVVFIPLVRDGALWKGGRPLTTRPSSPYLACRSSGGAAPDCGIGSLFVPQGKARRIERDIDAGRLAAVIRVDSRGHAAVIRLVPRS